jgi:hypothetical protein
LANLLFDGIDESTDDDGGAVDAVVVVVVATTSHCETPELGLILIIDTKTLHTSST